MFGVLGRIFKRKEKSPTDGTSLWNGVFQASETFHRQFLVECREHLGELKHKEDQLFSRRVRNGLNRMCAAAEKVISRCSEKPDTVSDLRELPSTLRRVNEMFAAFIEVSSPLDSNDSRRNREMCELLDGLEKSLQKSSEEMLLGSKINLSALREVLERVAAESRTKPAL